MSTLKNVQCESCKLSFIRGKMSTAARETAPQIALRNCSKENGGKDKWFWWMGSTCNHACFFQKGSDSLVKLLLVMRNSPHHEGFWRRQWHPTPVLLPGKSHGWRSLAGCSSWGREESDTTGWLQFHFSLPCIGEGNGNPLQCSCLENPRDGGAWWAAVYGVTQSPTRLKRFSSSSSSMKGFSILVDMKRYKSRACKISS